MRKYLSRNESSRGASSCPQLRLLGGGVRVGDVEVRELFKSFERVNRVTIEVICG
jgi:hypothetical protein